MEPTVLDWRRSLDAGELTAVELARHYLDRIARANPSLNAIVAIDEEQIIAQARKADRRLASGETDALLGIPVTIKDGLDVEGMPATCGSLVPRGGEPVIDAVVVQRIRAAGGLILGKTNLPELGTSYETDNIVYGRTNNPLDLDRTPGGSSGGEGAAIGADISPIGVGTDGGGSIRVPAHYCGILGLRPTVGRVPLTGSWPNNRASAFLDGTCVGPMGRSTADVATLLRVIHGHDLGDPFTHPVPLHDWTDARIGGMRVGWYVDDSLALAGPGAVSAVANAVSALQSRGANCRQVTAPRVGEATSLFFRLNAADGGQGVRSLVGDDPAQHTDQFLELVHNPPHGSSATAHEYFALLREVQAFRVRVRRWLQDFDLVLCPVTPGPAPLHGQPPVGVPAERYRFFEAFNYTHTYSLAGVPAGTVPAAVEEGMPVGVQVVSRAWREDLVLAGMQAIEAETSGFGIVDRRRS